MSSSSSDEGTPMPGLAAEGSVSLEHVSDEETIRPRRPTIRIAAFHGQTPFDAAKADNVPLLSMLLESSAKDGTVGLIRDGLGNSLLHIATEHASDRVMEHLLTYDIDVDALNNDGQSPYHWAAAAGALEVMELLREAGAQVDRLDKRGNNAVIIAATNGRKWGLHYLKMSGADMQVCDEEGHSALHWVAYQGHLECAQYLIEFAGADVRVVDKRGRTALHWAAVAGHYDVTRYLLHHNADPTVKDGESKTPVDAAESTRMNKVAALLQKAVERIESGEVTLLSKRTAKFKVKTSIPLRWWVLLLAFVYACTAMVTAIVIPQRVWFPVTVVVGCAVYIPLRKSHDVQLGLAMGAVVGNIVVYRWLIWETFRSTLGERVLVILFFVIGILMVGMYLLLCFSDPGRIQTRSVDEPEMYRLAEKGQGKRVLLEYCRTCCIRKPIRSKHCRFCGFCISRLDHHCPWTGGCIGTANHRFFVVYMVYKLLICIGLLVWYALYLKVNVGALSSDPWVFLVVTLHRPKAAAALWAWLVSFATSVFLLYLLKVQLNMIRMNVTTNEMVNMHRYSHFVRQSTTDGENEYFNPFGRGWVANCGEFWSGSRTVRQGTTYKRDPALVGRRFVDWSHVYSVQEAHAWADGTFGETPDV